MKYKINLKSRVITLLFLLITVIVLSQTRPPVLVLTGNNGFTTHFDTQNRISSQLLETGTQGQATIEFWVMKGHMTQLPSRVTGNGSWKYSNLLTGVNEFTITGADNQLSVKIGANEEIINLAGAEGFWNNEWRHVALTINKEASNLRLYIDGIQHVNSNYFTAEFSPELMYLQVTDDDQLSVAEYRAWNRTRTVQQIQDERFLTYSNENQSSLAQLNGLGLVIAYANNNFTSGLIPNLPTEEIIWNNIVSGSAAINAPTHSRITSRLQRGASHLKLAELRTDADHPIYSLKDVLLFASDGGEVSAAGKSIVGLRWPHIDGATNYIIGRRNLSDPASRFSTIASYAPSNQDAVSSYLKYTDAEILPNELYEYKVTAEGVENSTPGIDNGFVFANGVAYGSIETATRVATQGVVLEATPVTGNLPGKAIQFSENNSPININDVSLFEQSRGHGTIEFWYRTPTVGQGTNTVFKLNEGEIRINNTHITIVSKNPLQVNSEAIITYLKTEKPNDNEWHHYAFSFSPTGGALYIDGGVKQPTNKETPIVANKTTQTPFYVAIDRTSKFSFNAQIENVYELDEIRIWGTKKSTQEIYNYWNYILGSNTFPDLLAYYRLDMGDSYNIYNQASTTLGRFKGTSIHAFTTVSQPSQKVTEGDSFVYEPLKYGTYTNTEGRYRFTSINSGNQSATNSDNYLAYRITPLKPNNNFSPISEIRNIDRALNPGEPNAANFTNISAYDISGEVVYRVQNEGTSDYTEYPTVQNTGILLDGTEVTSTEPNSLVRTNNQGVFRITASPGRHTVAIGQPRLESSNIEIDRISLDFKNDRDGYAESNQNITETANNGFTWSGFIKPDVSIPNAGGAGETVLPAVQTILNWGSIRLELRNNNQLVLLSEETELLTKTIEESSQYTFFAITKDVSNNVIGLLINDDYQTYPYSGEDIDSKLYIGARYVGPTEFTNFSKANIDILEFRDSYYTPSQLSDIKMGNIIEADKESLKLSYTFEHRTGTRAVNLMVNSGADNNYLLLKEGAYFNDASSSRYIRQFKLNYVAFKAGDNAALVDPLNTKQYLFNLIEPTSSISFENTTRRSFVGNIVIPCNNNVGNWIGTITRTDVAFPRYERPITASNFNSENNLFTIHNLLPGQYRVELTREGTNDTVQSSIIDLRNGNKSYDFPYRNELQAELELYSVTKEELEQFTTMEALEERRIDATCGTDGDIYKLEAGKSILAVVSVYEDYNGSRCPVEGARIDLTGDMIIAATNGMSGVTGKQSFLTFAGNPNFLGDYLRNLSIAVSHNSRNTTVTNSSYITGAQRGNEDFTLTDPTIGFTLYDPPGDASSSTLNRGATYSFSKSVGGGVDVSTDTSVTIGADVETQMVSLVIAAPLGVGVGQGIIYTAVESESKFNGNLTADFTYRHTEQNGTSLSLSQSISTSSSSDIVGADADIFIGASRVLTFGTGRTLTVNESCQPVVENDRTVMTADDLTPFVYTRQDIEDRIIRNLQNLLIIKHDEFAPPTEEALNNRSSLDYQTTIDGFAIDTSLPDTDKEIVNYVYQINRWKEIVKRKSREEQLTYFNDETQTFASTTANLTSVGSGLGSGVSQLDSQISFSGATSTTYTLTRANETSNQDSGGSTLGGGTTLSTNFNVLGVTFGLKTDLKILGVVEASDNTGNTNAREDSFTLSDGDVGDQFSVRIARDKMYDTPIFYTVAGQSSCPFESGTAPREGVEIIVDSAVKYGVGDGSILYNLTLRNTQVANDATRKVYIVGMNGASNSDGAQVFLNESPIFEPTTSSTINFGLDGKSPTGVVQEVEAQLRITRGLDASEDISYENIGIRIYSACEQAGDGYRSYRVDEYNEVGVVPFQEVFVTAHFSGACISEVEPDMPAENWVVNGGDQDRLDFRFRIPEITKESVTVAAGFSVDLEYAIEGNNDPLILRKLSLTELIDNLQDDGFITYSADVSVLVDGAYSFRVTPVCDDGGANLPASRQNPTAYVIGRISRVAPLVISTNPVNGGVLTEGQITAEFNRAINPLTAVNSSFSLRGILGGVPQDLISAEFSEIGDEVVVPHQSIFDVTGAFTLEMWVNPGSFPNGVNVPIIEKGNNYSVKLSPEGKVLVNDTVISSKSLQPFSWTHVTAVYDGVNTVTIYFNGVSVGSGTITSLVANEEAIEIAKPQNGNSFIGKLDEVRVWALDRSPTEIVANFDEQLVGNEIGLLAYFVFDDNALEGVYGAPNEAIRDYTGNAIATTAVGLSFVRGSANAAPLDVSRVAKNLQYSIVTSNNDTQVHIIPVFDASFIEGAQLTAMVNSNRLEDPAGNQVKGKSWSFVVNRNTIHWSQNNITVSQTQGESTRITTIDLDNSEGGAPVKYRFKNLPSWLTVNKREGQVAIPIDAGVDNDLAATFVERNLEFVVAPYLNAGVHNTDVYVEIFQTVNNRDVPLGVEAFNLKVEVNCAVPNFAENFNSNLYLGNMNITGRLMFEDVQSLDTGDIVIAYLNGEYRGQANVDSNGVLNLSVFGNNDESGNLNFNIWDSSECTEYKGIVEIYIYGFRSVIGTINTPVTLTVGQRLTRRIPIVEGYQEISFNVRNNNDSNELSLNSIKGLSSGDRILNANTIEVIAVVNTDGTYNTTNNIQTLDIREAYLIQSSTSKVIEVEGVLVPLDTNITIAGGNVINTIPYLPNNLQTVPLALRSLTSTSISEGDRISRRGLNAVYTTTNGWVGSLTHLASNLGYLYQATNGGVLNYSGIASELATQAREGSDTSEEGVLSYLDKAKAINWKVNRNLYPNFMYMTASLETNELDLDRDYVIAAFVNNEVRGVAKPELIEGEYRYFIGIGGYSDAEITFKLYDGKDVLDLDNVVNFERTVTKGSISTPYELNYSAKNELTTTVIEKGYTLNQNVPNPMKNTTHITYSVPTDEFVDISLYNLLGQKVHTFIADKVVGNKMHTIYWNKQNSNVSLIPGVYIYRLTSSNKILTRKLIVK